MIELIPLHGLPIITPGVDLPALISEHLEELIREGDIVVVTHSIVSVAENKLFKVNSSDGKKDNRTEIAIKEAREVIRETPILITRTIHGLITDFSGVDESNAPPGMLIGLPDDPDASAENICNAISKRVGFGVPVIITDTQGRPWRQGAINLAIGVAGMSPFVINKGRKDIYGKTLQSSLVCIADEIAASAELVMGQADEKIPIAIVRGISYTQSTGTAHEILREESKDLFR